MSSQTPLIPREEYLLGLPKKRMGSGVIIRNNTGEILLLKTSYKETWEIPGGSVDQGESPKACAGREVKEEIGIDLEVGKLLALEYKTTEFDDALMFVFDGGIIEEKDITIDNYEIVEAKFVDPKKIDQYLTHLGLLQKVNRALTSEKNGIYYE